MTVSVRAAAVLLATLALVGCAPTGDESEFVESTAQPVYPELTTNPDIRVLSDIEYGSVDGEALLLDVCLPPEVEPEGSQAGSAADATAEVAATTTRAAIVAIHGGSWRRGDKADLDWRAVCQWLASEGYVAVSINYRLAPAATFPAQLDDVQAAVAWLRDPAQLATFEIDPARIGVFGASAGGNLAALAGATGSGDLTQGTRVAAVATLSGVSDLRAVILTGPEYTGDFAKAQLEYLGCPSFDGCETATWASPVTQVDPTDPPFFVAHSVDEFIPVAQSDGLVTALRDAGIETTYLTVEGSAHALRMLDDEMMRRVIEFFAATLVQ